VDLDRRGFLMGTATLLGASAAAVAGAAETRAGEQGAFQAVRASTAAELYGSSPGGAGPAAMAGLIAQVAPRMVRCYDGGQPQSFANTAQARWVPLGLTLFHSTKPNLSLMARGDRATLNAVLTTLLGEPDVPGVRVCIQHEPENPGKDAPPWGTNSGSGAIRPADFRAAWSVYLDLVDAANTGRSHALRPVPTFMGFSLSVRSRDIGGQWMPDDSRVKEVGFDCYQTAELAAAHAFAQARGLHWCVPEWGFSALGVTPTDAQYRRRMSTDHAVWTQFARRPTCVLLFNRGADSLSNHPRSAGFWRALCAL